MVEAIGAVALLVMDQSCIVGMAWGRGAATISLLVMVDECSPINGVALVRRAEAAQLKGAKPWQVLRS